MAVRVEPTGGKGTFAGGVRAPEQKRFTEHAAIEVAPTPTVVQIALLQHTGAACEPTVTPPQAVALGEKVGDSAAYVAAPVHASVAGTAQRVALATLPNGRRVKTVPVEAGAQPFVGRALWEEIFGGEWPWSGLEQYEPSEIVRAVREAGLVGLGGAAFPTHVKLTRNEKRPVDTVLLNGCECEPYLTADHRLMVEAPGPIVVGALLAARAVGAGRIVVAIEDNKPDAVEAMRRAAAGTPVSVAVVCTRYPMGGERQTVRAVLGRVVPTGGLPLDVGVVVLNVGTAAAVARAVCRRKPLTHRVITVTGSGVVQPKNLLVPIGMSYADALACAGGLRPEAARVIAGGPMMGHAIGDLTAPITKGTSGIVALTGDEVARVRETECVRCGECVEACPLRLVPTRIALCARHRDWDGAKRYYASACMECGCCAYVCPAGIPLVQLIRVAKAELARGA